MPINIIQADTNEHIEEVRELFLEYAMSLDFNLCFQGFDEELTSLPGEYSPPDGTILLAFVNNSSAGCVALRKIEHGICEMKRLYVKPEFRGSGVGRQLANKIIQDAINLGYKKIYLDTVPAMREAISLYKKLGFNEIPSYRYNPQPGALYMELELKQ